jgi:hypothetical protein
MKTADQITKDLSYLFSKINWGASNIDAKSAEIMNTIGADIKALETPKKANKITHNRKDKTIIATGPKGIASALALLAG